MRSRNGRSDFVESKGTASGVHMNRRTNRGESSACGGSARQKWLVYGAEVANQESAKRRSNNKEPGPRWVRCCCVKRRWIGRRLLFLV